jgi:hypothetical protein
LRSLPFFSHFVLRTRNWYRFLKKGINFPCVIQNDWKTANFAGLYYPHFATKLRNITNFVMLFHAVIKFLSRLARSKFCSLRNRSIGINQFQLKLKFGIHWTRQTEKNWKFTELELLFQLDFFHMGPRELSWHLESSCANIMNKGKWCFLLDN